MPGFGARLLPDRLADRGFLIVAAAILALLLLSLWLTASVLKLSAIDSDAFSLAPSLAAALHNGEAAPEEAARFRAFLGDADLTLPTGWQSRTELILAFGSNRYAIAIARAGGAGPLAPAVASAASWGQFVQQIGLALQSLARLGVPARLILSRPDGSRLEFEAPAVWSERPNPVGLGLTFVAGLIAILLVAHLAMRRLARPFARIAAIDVIEPSQLGSEIVPEAGALEARLAARAINRVSAVLAQVLEERTRFFAAISHDLQTPLTRLRLRLETIEDEAARRRMIRDLDETAGMITATLDFLRNDALRESVEVVAFASLIESVIADFTDLGRPVTYEEAKPLAFAPARSPFGGGGAALAFEHRRQLLLACRPNSLKRAFANLIENALKYGQRAHVRVEADSQRLVVEIIDRGPGIPEAEMARIFEPFYRLERSRDRSTGGSGLGLAIVKSILEAHGGSILLENREQGGLLARVEIPRHLEV